MHLSVRCLTEKTMTKKKKKCENCAGIKFAGFEKRRKYGREDAYITEI